MSKNEFQRADSELPVLKIVPTANLVLHEYTDPVRIQALVERLTKDGILKNPIIVAPIPHTRKYVVLDGANRASALLQVGCRDALVQVVDYSDPNLELSTWNHLIVASSIDDVLVPIRAMPNIRVRPLPIDLARGLLVNRGLLAYVSARDNQVYGIEGGLGLDDEAELLNQVVKTYHGRLRYFRVKSDDIAHLIPYYEDVVALLVFPCFEPDDILHLSANGAKLPAGITRHVIPQRALRVNIPLHILQEDRPLEEKNAWLHELIKTKLVNRQIRFYQEPTVLFDE